MAKRKYICDNCETTSDYINNRCCNYPRIIYNER